MVCKLSFDLLLPFISFACRFVERLSQSILKSSAWVGNALGITKMTNLIEKRKKLRIIK